MRADGRPHLAPVWFDLDGEDLAFSTWHKSVKGAKLCRDPRVVLALDDERPPYAFVLIEDTAALCDDLGERRRLASGCIAAADARSKPKRRSLAVRE